jgi:hypothetical protein
MTISELSALSSLAAGDLFPVYSGTNGDTRKVAASVILAYIQAALSFPVPITQYAAPLTGTTLQVMDGDDSIRLILTPAGTIATLTLKFPAKANCVDKQEVIINTTQQITTLTPDGNGASVVGFAAGTLAANGYLHFMYDSTLSTWYRIG